MILEDFDNFGALSSGHHWDVCSSCSH